MKPLSQQEQFSDQEILDNLKSSGVTKRKGENQLFEKYSYFMKVGIGKYRLSEDSVFDAYSDTILAGIESIYNRSFKEKSSLKTFLFQIFQNKCIDVLRKKASRRNTAHNTMKIDESLIQVSDPSKSILEKLIEKGNMETVKQQLQKLCDKKQRMLLLSAEGYTDKEIAIEMNFKTRDVVKTSRLRCISILRKLKIAC